MRAGLPYSGVALALLAALPAATSTSAEIDMAAATREYQIVPCLLPARVRKLGNMVYPERRRLVETSARQCELRGGEYTFYDRAQPDSAAQFFRKLADEGDLDAQVSLGDVYQYLYTPPRYEDAVAWYAKASEAGSNKAKMQLARLYERGLGTEQDGLLAVNLWREATGAGEELVLASELEAARTAADERIAQLTEQLQRRSEEAEQARQLLATAQSEVAERRGALAAAQREADALRRKVAEAQTGNPEELARLRTQLAAQQRTIDDQRFQIESMEDDLGVQESQLAASLKRVEAQNQRLSRELERVNAQADQQLADAMSQLEAKDAELAQLAEDLAAARASLNDSDGAYSTLVAQLEESRRAAAQDDAAAARRVAELESRQTEQASRLQAQRARAEELEAALATATREAQSLRGQLDNQINETSEAQAQFARAEAELSGVRAELAARTQRMERANEQLASLERERNDLQARLERGIAQGQTSNSALEAQLAERDSRLREQRATIVGLQAEIEDYRGQIQEINVRRASYVTRSPMEDTSGIRLPRNVKVGRYHAVVIGNNDYQYLTDLQNAQNDARSVHELLETEYGFRSKLLMDASRLDMFQAIAELMELTGPDDLVLIYYAGHGYRMGGQSYWLPVEVASRQQAPGAGLSSEEIANWIKNIPARHVMIIADSCYSGAGIETAGGFKYSAEDLEMMLPFLIRSRSRTMLTSGGDGPVMDGGGEGEHSVFTRELLGLLKENKGVLHGEQMYSYMMDRVKFTVEGDAINQTPTFGSIERAGHESGQFVFMRKRGRS